MTCTPFTIDGKAVGFICGPRPRRHFCACGLEAELLCDAPIAHPTKRRPDCSAWVCSKCVRSHEGKDYCSAHRAMVPGASSRPVPDACSSCGGLVYQVVHDGERTKVDAVPVQDGALVLVRGAGCIEARPVDQAHAGWDRWVLHAGTCGRRCGVCDKPARRPLADPSTPGATLEGIDFCGVHARSFAQDNEWDLKGRWSSPAWNNSREAIRKEIRNRYGSFCARRREDLERKAKLKASGGDPLGWRAKAGKLAKRLVTLQAARADDAVELARLVGDVHRLRKMKLQAPVAAPKDKPTPDLRLAFERERFEQIHALGVKALGLARFCDVVPDWRPGEPIPEDFYALPGGAR